MSKVFSIGGNTISYGGFMLREAEAGSLTISKTVSGTGFDPTKSFELQVVFSAPVTYNGTTSTTHTIRLAHGQSVTIPNIAAGTTYAVTESLSPADVAAGYSLGSITGDTGTFVGEGDSHTAAATNTYSEVLQPGHIRFQFSNPLYDPSRDFVPFAMPHETPSHAGSGTWTRVSSSPNVWDYYRDFTLEPDCTNEFRCGSYGGTGYGFNNWSVDRGWPGTIQVLTTNLQGATCTHAMFAHIDEEGTIFNEQTEDDEHVVFYRLVSADIRGMSGVTDASSMFTGCEGLQAVSLLDTSSLTSTEYMFYGCFALQSVTLFDTSNVTKAGCMFYNCRALQSVPLFDLSSVTDAASMFAACYTLQSVPLFDLSSAVYMGEMFSRCLALRSVPLFDTSSATDVVGMFRECTSVESGALALYQQMSSQAALQPYANHRSAFLYCGSDTTTGAAELAQIPTSWGGTAT